MFSKYIFQNFLFVYRICVYLIPLSRFHTIIPLDRIKFKIIICSLFQRPNGSDAPTEKHETNNSKSLKKNTSGSCVCLRFSIRIRWESEKIHVDTRHCTLIKKTPFLYCICTVMVQVTSSSNIAASLTFYVFSSR